MDSFADFAQAYQKLDDDQLVQLASEGGFTELSHQALNIELQRRNITSQRVSNLQAERHQEETAVKAKRTMSLKGTGLVFFGRNYLSESDKEKNIQVRTKWFALLGFPVFPIASYRFAYTTHSKLKLWWSDSGTFVEQIPLQWNQVLLTWTKAIATVTAVYLILYLHILWRRYAQ